MSASVLARYPNRSHNHSRIKQDVGYQPLSRAAQGAARSAAVLEYGEHRSRKMRARSRRMEPDAAEGEGVEPSVRRMAPLTGFEARPSHRRRFPSTGRRHRAGSENNSQSPRRRWTSPTRRSRPMRSKYSTIWIARLRPMPVASRNAAALTLPSRAAISRTSAAACAQRRRRVVQILDDLVQLAAARAAEQRGTDQRLGLARVGGERSHPGRIEAAGDQTRHDLLDDQLLGRGQARAVARQVRRGRRAARGCRARSPTRAARARARRPCAARPGAAGARRRGRVRRAGARGRRRARRRSACATRPRSDRRAASWRRRAARAACRAGSERIAVEPAFGAPPGDEVDAVGRNGEQRGEALARARPARSRRARAGVPAFAGSVPARTDRGRRRRRSCASPTRRAGRCGRRARPRPADAGRAGRGRSRPARSTAPRHGSASSSDDARSSTATLASVSLAPTCT